MEAQSTDGHWLVSGWTSLGVMLQVKTKKFTVIVAHLQAASYPLRIKDVGALLSLTVELDGKSVQQAWQCTMITLEHAVTSDITYFACDKWAPQLGQCVGILGQN